MLRSFEFCIPAKGIKVPAGPEWFHEIKYDGYRLRRGSGLSSWRGGWLSWRNE
jgi:hypothetical protein